MSEEIKQTQDSTGEEKTEKKPITEDSSKNVSSNMIPKARFDEVNTEKNQYKEELEKFKSEREEAEKIRLEEQGKFKEANEKYRTENESLKQKAEQWDSYQSSRRDTLMKSLPEEQREFAEDMNLEKLEKFVSTITPKSKEAPTTFADSPGAFQKNNLPDDWTTMSPDEKRKNWSSILKSKLSKN